jgi:hypothetical protein
MVGRKKIQKFNTILIQPPLSIAMSFNNATTEKNERFIFLEEWCNMDIYVFCIQ